MSVKSGKDSEYVARFRAALNDLIVKSGKNREGFANDIEIKYGTLTSVLNGTRAASIAFMEEVADNLNMDLSDMLIAGRALISGKELPEQKPNPESIEKSNDTLIFIRSFKQARKITGIKQKEIATKLGVTPAAINPYATGKIEPGLSLMIKIAAAFGYHIVDFLALGREE